MRQQRKRSQKEKMNISSEDEVRGEGRNGGSARKRLTEHVFFLVLTAIIKSRHLQRALQATQQIKSNYTNNDNVISSSTEDKKAAGTVHHLITVSDRWSISVTAHIPSCCDNNSQD